MNTEISNTEGPALSPAISQAVAEAAEVFNLIRSTETRLNARDLAPRLRRQLQTDLERYLRRAVQKADAFIVTV